MEFIVDKMAETLSTKGIRYIVKIMDITEEIRNIVGQKLPITATPIRPTSVLSNLGRIFTV